MRDRERLYRDADVDANENGDNENGFENVVHHSEAGAQSVDLRVAVGGDGGKNAHGTENAHTELDFFLLQVRAGEGSYGEEEMGDLPAAGEEEHGDEEDVINERVHE